MATATSKRRDKAVNRVLAAVEQMPAAVSLLPEAVPADEPLLLIVQIETGQRVSTITGEVLAEADGRIPYPSAATFGYECSGCFSILRERRGSSLGQVHQDGREMA